MKRALVIAVACGCHSDPPPSTATVKLLDPGAEPRRAFAYAPRGDDREVRFEMEGLITVVDWKLVQADPPRYHFKGKDMLGTDQAPASSDEHAVMKEIATLSAGDIGADVHGRATAAQGARQSSIQELLGLSIVPMPAAPVGVGARWHVGGRAAPADHPLDAALDYDLVAFDGDAVRVHWKGSFVDHDTGAIAETVEATMTVRATDLLPVSGQITEHIDIDLGSNAPKMPDVHITLR